MLPKPCLILLIIVCLCHTIAAQDSASTSHKILNFPSSFISTVNKKNAKLQAGLIRQTKKYLRRLAKKELRLKEQLSQLDSSAARNCFAIDPQKQYHAHIEQFESGSGTAVGSTGGTYMPYLDSLTTGLSFLNANPSLVSAVKLSPEDVQKSLSRLQGLQSRMQQADRIKEFLQQRKQHINGFIGHYTKLPKGLTADLNKYNKQLYYYDQQVKTYKDMLNDPDRMLKTALQLLNKVPAFTSFMQKHSMLAALFNIPGGASNTANAQTATGLSSRSQVMTAIQNQVGGKGPAATAMMQQNIGAAQARLTS